MVAPARSRLTKPLLNLLCAAATALALFWCPAASAQSLETREQELSDIRAQIEHLREQVTSIRSRETSLEDRLRRVTAELELQQARVDEADAALALATLKADEAEARVADLGRALDEVRSDLRRRLVGLYRLGRHGYLRLLLAIEPSDDLLRAIRQLRYLVLRDDRALERYDRLRARQKVEVSTLDSERRQIADWQQQEAERRDQLSSIRQRRSSLLVKVSRERRRLAAETNQLEVKERKLVSLISGRAGAVPLEGVPIQNFRGVLDWPASGAVTGEFGSRKDARYRTEVPHKGLDIEPASDRRVRTVYSGRVIYASTFEGYGLMAVVEHPGAVFSLYAGLELLSVDEGDVLSLGDVIGASADRLYFELRVGNTPEDPREWLR